MAQIYSGYTAFTPSQRLLQKQGVGSRSAAVQNKIMRKLAVWLLAVTLLALFYVWSRVQVLELGYQIDTLEKIAAEKQKEISSLNMDISKLKSLERLEAVAKTELFMAPPAAGQILLVKPSAPVAENR